MIYAHWRDIVHNVARFDIQLIILMSKVCIDELIGIMLYVSTTFLDPTFSLMFNNFFEQILIAQAAIKIEFFVSSLV